MKPFDELLEEYNDILWQNNRGYDQTTGLDTVQIDVTPDDAPEDITSFQKFTIYHNERALYYLLYGYRDQIVKAMSNHAFVDGHMFHKSFRNQCVKSGDGVNIDGAIHACLSYAPIFWHLFDKHFQIDKEKYTFKTWEMTKRGREFERHW